MIEILYLALLGLANNVPSNSSHVQCDKVEVTEINAPESTVEVTRLDVDGFDEYMIETDSYYGEWPLYAVRFISGTADKVLVDTWIMKFDVSETKAGVDVVLDSSLLSNTVFTFVYVEPDVLCPKSVRINFKLPLAPMQPE